MIVPVFTLRIRFSRHKFKALDYYRSSKGLYSKVGNGFHPLLF